MNDGERPELDEAKQTPGATGAEANVAQVNALASQAMDAVHKAVDDLTALLRANTPAAVSALKDASRQAGENIGGLARGLKDDARDIGSARLDDLSVAVRRNPLTSLAIAAGVGLVIGLWNRRGDRP